MYPAVIRIKDRNRAGEGFSHAVFDGQYYCFSDGEQCRLEALRDRFEIYDVRVDELANMLDKQAREKTVADTSKVTRIKERCNPTEPPKSLVAAGIRQLVTLSATGSTL